MVLNDTLSTAMSKILDYEEIGKKQVQIYPSSKVVKKVLDILNQKNYLGEYDETKTNRGEALMLNLLGKINKCGVIKPRFSVKKDNFEKTDALSVGEEVRKRLLKYWLEGPIVVSAWQGPSAVVVARKIRGHTFPVDAEPGTLHATYGFDSPLLATTKDRVVKTFIHTSGSIEEANREIDYWFKNYDFKDYETLIEHLYIR